MASPETLAKISRRLPNFRGKVVLAWRYMHWYHRRRRAEVTWHLTTVEGDRFVLPSTAQMAWTAAFSGRYDAEHQDLLASYIAPGTVALDIGAALGLWTIPLARVADRKGATVHAIEPHPQNFVWLQMNTALNGFQHSVTEHEKAVGSEPGTVRLQVMEGRASATAGNALIVDDDSGAAAIPLVTIDDLDFGGRISAVKIDVEGFEVRVLRGAWQTILRDRPAIFGEFNQHWIKHWGDDLPALLADFEGIGYDVFAVEGRHSRPWSATKRLALRRLDPGETAEDLLIRPTSAIPSG